ncbi:ribonuclease R [Flammeovirgaceae bacterium SG7u.111]|nr:ribonuclease R [Flammeovirgaceae bacterium SG7u.132]WPO35547.1 ribonuclease R [Flammeovirgaceae bacterium SG7u.111]
MKKKNKTRHSKPKKVSDNLVKKIITLLNANENVNFSRRQLAKALKIHSHKAKVSLGMLIDEMARKGMIENVHGEYYTSNKAGDTFIGTVDFVNPSFAFVIIEGQENDVRVSSRRLKGALHGDKVKLKMLFNSRRNRPEGEVLEVVERHSKEFAGKIEFSKNFAFVVPNNRKMHTDIFIPREMTKKAENGEKVVVEIIEWPVGDKSPVGRVKHVLGKSGENETEIHSIMFEYGLPFKFPDHIEKAAKSISEEITSEEIKKRRDFREITTFTIDPENAKDFDDALSIQYKGNGIWEIGIHIADVSHYVMPDSILEKEAYERATSVYLVDRTIPMLPEQLSNGLCSLRPKEEKLTFSAVFELDEKGKIHNEWFGRTVIYSDRRFTYEEAQETLETNEGEYAEELSVLNKIAKVLKDKRFKAGAIGFESTEFYFKLDENGKPLELTPKIRKDAHKLIEEFMLLANKQVATFVFNQRKGKDKNTMVYRVHEDPDPEKVMNFALFAKRFGYQVNTSGNGLAKSLNKIAQEVEGKPEQTIMQYQAIRTMSKARYTTEPFGHYGLAFKHYSHFTSPIRRYPDVMTHRLLQHYLDGGKPAEKEEYESKCKHSSEREKVASDAERASVKYKQVEFMQQFMHEEMEGIISSLTEWGMYIEINDTKCEGMLRIADLPNDEYYYDEDRQYVSGRSSGEIFRLGDPLLVKVIGTNLERRNIDLSLVERISQP